jgi:hypothetical protein
MDLNQYVELVNLKDCIYRNPLVGKYFYFATVVNEILEELESEGNLRVC